MRGVATAALGIAAVVVSACGGGDSDRFVLTDPETPFVPVIESTDLALGVERVVLRLVDRAAAPLFPAGTTFTLRTFEPVEGGVRFRTDAALTVVTVGEETFYVGAAPFDGAGQWALQVRAQPPGEELLLSPRLPFEVAATTATPSVGSLAPASPTLTSPADGPLSQVTSAADPDPALYQTSVAEALAAGRPFVLALTTVGLCFGRGLCQRAVDQVSRLGAEAGVLAIHAEPLTEVGGEEAPLPSPSGVLTEWNLQNDPWIFVVGGDGRIVARFERLATDAELRAALSAVE